LGSLSQHSADSIGDTKCSARVVVIPRTSTVQAALMISAGDAYQWKRCPQYAIAVRTSLTGQ
jgi:hypothetical protein